MILHITNDYNLTKVHKQLYTNLDLLGFEQKVYIPLRDNNKIGKNHFEFNCNNSSFVYSEKINILHKIIFPWKILNLYKCLIKQIDVKQIELVHATTLFSDGAVAYKLFKNFNIPYIVAVRNTDINFYFKRRKELTALGIDILKNANKIIFISESNKKSFLDLNPIKCIYSEIVSKIIVLNNGIDDFWIKNIQPYKNNQSEYTFLFIGRFDKNKNIENLIKGLKSFKEKHNLAIRLNVVGGQGVNHFKVLKVIEANKWIKYYGEVYDKTELHKIFMNSNYFTMISHMETFGLVFIEALSQGKSILFTKNQGVDGMFDFEVGESVDSKSIENISNQLEKLVSKKYESIREIDFNNFTWSEIALKYKQIYKEIIK
ncbi:glycosyltransferase family 4 protein [Myroides guanonis]|uniref:Glycosyltransferase involved in cell wall bisynthesis n=1 Tax=Myroides guanonis TaxID=1150112 RepID=A0A1I3L441_9FLAO|nr:glycosyltransferase family 4 protein [Myroides guanonis]SFI79491.1 Glycosyltransferase involved in cell wall bisynthesis [Myroides guanonis]